MLRIKDKTYDNMVQNIVEKEANNIDVVSSKLDDLTSLVHETNEKLGILLARVETLETSRSKKKRRHSVRDTIPEET